nr:EOG090X02D0 [Macrothrix elegans]
MANISRVRSRKRAKGEIRHLIAPPRSNEVSTTPFGTSEQPLNLCVRDESLTVLVPSKKSTELDEHASKIPSVRRRKKRSAIFLPPQKLADNDVCICKFKFVAGHTPRLQEKKILSVDSGGNFRFFPELQQHETPAIPTSLPSSSTSSRSPAPNVSQHQVGCKPIPDLLPIEAVNPAWNAQRITTPPVSTSPSSTIVVPNQQIDIGSNVSTKKLSRRQKMEQTFGEKGFLIQTQHVPATEGAAFCKFRQLKKFTRYLYRSWKHYLPEENPTASTTTDDG